MNEDFVEMVEDGAYGITNFKSGDWNDAKAAYVTDIVCVRGKVRTVQNLNFRYNLFTNKNFVLLFAFFREL